MHSSAMVMATCFACGVLGIGGIDFAGVAESFIDSLLGDGVLPVKAPGYVCQTSGKRRRQCDSFRRALWTLAHQARRAAALGGPGEQQARIRRPRPGENLYVSCSPDLLRLLGGAEDLALYLAPRSRIQVGSDSSALPGITNARPTDSTPHHAPTRIRPRCSVLTFRLTSC
jgi:hypothetical protein